MKKIILSLVVILSVCYSGALFAQNQNGEQMQHMMKAYLKDSVMLSDALVDSVMAVRMSFMPQMRSVYMDQSLSTADKQAKLDEIRTQMDDRYKVAGLKDEQVKMIEEHDARMRQQMRNKMGGGQSN